MRVLKVLVACEESQEVTKAFRALGHEAYSCDVQECSGGHPEWHFKQSIFEVISLKQWDLMIGFPPCTYLSSVQLFRMNGNPERQAKKELAKKFFTDLWESNIPRIALENPVGCISTELNIKPKQTIHPWYFGDMEMKRTCLWLKGLPRLNGLPHIAADQKKYRPKPRRTFISAKGETKNIYFANDPKDIGDSRARSKFWPSVAKAMADQWSRHILSSETEVSIT